MNSLNTVFVLAIAFLAVFWEAAFSGLRHFIGAQIDLSVVAASQESAADQSEEKNAALSRDAATVRLDALLFGETQSRVVISCKALDAVKVVERAKLMGVPAVQIGKVGGDKLTVKTASGEFSAPLTELHDAWWNSIARAMA